MVQGAVSQALQVPHSYTQQLSSCSFAFAFREVSSPAQAVQEQECPPQPNADTVRDDADEVSHAPQSPPSNITACPAQATQDFRNSRSQLRLMQVHPVAIKSFAT